MTDRPDHDQPEDSSDGDPSSDRPGQPDDRPGQTIDLSQLGKRGDGGASGSSSDPGFGGSDFKTAARDRFTVFADEMRLSVQRSVRSDFTRVEALPEERESLEAAEVPVRDELTQNYAAWRRSVLWLAGGFLVVHCLVLMGSYRDAEEVLQEQSRKGLEETARAQLTRQDSGGWDRFGNYVPPKSVTPSASEVDQAVETQLSAMAKVYGKDNLALFDIVNLVLILSTVIGTILISLAARKWTDVGRSRDLTRYGFFAMFLTPIVLNLVPLSNFLDFSHLNSPEFPPVNGVTPAQQIQFMETTFGTMLAVSLLLYTAPKIIAVFAGAIRSAITVKTLIPESSTPGFAVTTLAPLYAIFLVVAFGTVNQFQGDYTLLGGTICLLIVPIVYVIHSNAFMKPQDRAGAAITVTNARRAALVFNIVGFSLVGIFVLELEFMEVEDLVQLGTLFVGNVLVLSVVGSDFMLYSIYRDYQQTRDVTGTGLIESLEGKISHFDELGLTRLRRQQGTDLDG